MKAEIVEKERMREVEEGDETIIGGGEEMVII